VIPEGGTAMIYVDQAQARNFCRRPGRRCKGWMASARSSGRTALRHSGLPTPDKEPPMSQLLFTAKDGYSFSGATGGPDGGGASAAG
jgi:hypothetical protein